jgi:acyl carrier protein
MSMTPQAVHEMLVEMLERLFEIKDPGLDENLRDAYDFDSIDAIELLAEMEEKLERELSHEERKQAMEIRTLRNIEDYVLLMQKS